MRKQIKSEEVFYNNLVTLIKNTLINDPNFKGTWSEPSFYDKEGKVHYGLFVEKANIILEEIEKTKHLIEFKDSLEIPDIRNKLSPITNMIALFERGDYAYIKNKGLDEVKKSINYLTQREVYENIK